MKISFLLIFSLAHLSSVVFGQDKDWLILKDSVFTSLASNHFMLYTVEGHLSRKTKLDILHESICGPAIKVMDGASIILLWKYIMIP